MKPYTLDPIPALDLRNWNVTISHGARMLNAPGRPVVLHRPPVLDDLREEGQGLWLPLRSGPGARTAGPWDESMACGQDSGGLRF